MNVDLNATRPELSELIVDLTDEREALRAAIVEASVPADLETPSPGWCVREQLAHLTFYDRAAATAIMSPDRFADMREKALSDTDAFEATTLVAAPRNLPELISDWDDAFESFIEAAKSADPMRRVPWFGPDMALRSMASARLMETWAHGRDVLDSAGIGLPATEALRHIVTLAYRARRYAHTVRNLTPPSADCRASLTSPSGVVWHIGAANGELVSGSAEDFCLVLTRRRHVDDTAIECLGDTAREWMTIGQAFAGPPGPGPRRISTTAR